jgi:membrane protein DedA with SNARE-associated domain
VIVCGFLGTLCGDQFFFYLGRTRGVDFLKRHSHWRSKSEWVSDLLNRHPSLLVLGFRFLYGLRSLTPFLLGANGFAFLRFLILDSIGAFLWAVLVGLAGYLFGQVAQFFLGSLERYELRLFLGLVLLSATFWGIHWFRKRKGAEKSVQPERPLNGLDSHPAPSGGEPPDRK